MAESQFYMLVGSVGFVNGVHNPSAAFLSLPIYGQDIESSGATAACMPGQDQPTPSEPVPVSCCRQDMHSEWTVGRINVSTAGRMNEPGLYW